MHEEYVEPELKFAGEATEIVKGWEAAGVDYDAMMMSHGMEFENDFKED